MRGKSNRLVAALLLLFYVVALVHIVLPVHQEEEPGYLCPMAYLLSAIAWFFVAIPVSLGLSIVPFLVRLDRSHGLRLRTAAPRAPPRILTQ